MQSLSYSLKQVAIKKDNRNKYEFQAYGNRLAEEFKDFSKRSLYIKLAKFSKRELLEEARLFALAQDNNPNKAKAFMWKLGELKKAEKQKKEVCYSGGSQDA
jgi:hypothetical protein